MDQQRGDAMGSGGCYATLGAALVPLLGPGAAVPSITTAQGLTCPNLARACTNAAGSDCAAGDPLLAGRTSGCCPCRLANAGAVLYPSVTSGNAFGLAPYCTAGGASLAGGTTLQYSGALVTVTNPAAENGCAAGNYALVVVGVSLPLLSSACFVNACVCAHCS